MARLQACFSAFGVEIISFPVDGSLDAEALTTHGVELVLLKLTSTKANGRLFRELQKGDFAYLNSLRSVKVCQSRRATFAFARKRLPDLGMPRAFLTLDEARTALAEGTIVWVRRDLHNIPTAQRVLGVACSVEALDGLIGDREPRTLFFQEYLGGTNETYKAYVVDTSIFALKRTGPQNGVSPDLAVAIERVGCPKVVEDAILRIGKAFDMAVYGVDFLYRDGHAVFFDFNDFPSFRGIPEASPLIREFAARKMFPETLTGSSAGESR